MAIETAAAILTKLAFEQSAELKSRLNLAHGSEKDLVALIMPLFRQMLSEIEKDRQNHERFPSPLNLPSPGRSDNAPQPDSGAIEHAHTEEHSGEEEEIGGES
jgi:hypothetical protein